MIKEIFIRNKLAQKIAKVIVRRSHVLADPNRYVRCDKRTPNPQVFLKDEYLKNCEVLSCREVMLEKFQRGEYGRKLESQRGISLTLFLRLVNQRSYIW